MRLRNRIVKATAWTDGDMLRWHRDKREFYRSLWACAEDSCCLVDDMFEVKLTAWASPLDSDMTVERFEEWRDELIESGKLVRYGVNGALYLFIPNMAEHERPRNPQAPDYPLPPWVAYAEVGEGRSRRHIYEFGDYKDFQDTSVQTDSGNRNTTVQTASGNRNTSPVLSCPVQNLNTRPKRSKTERSLDGFDEFWKEQTRKEGKGAARSAYSKALKTATSDVILAGWLRSRKAYAAEGRDRKHYPLPATWLNQERWDDDYSEPKKVREW